MPTRGATAADKPNAYAFVYGESAVEAIWSLAAHAWRGVEDDENVWLIPDASLCVTTQRDVKLLAKQVDLCKLGIRRRPIELLVPSKSSSSRGKLARFHVWTDFFPERSFVRVHQRVFVSTPYFTALQLAMARRTDGLTRAEAEASAREETRIRNELGMAEQTASAEDLVRWANIARFVRATQVLCDFMGTYRFVADEDKSSAADSSIVYGTKPMVTSQTFDTYVQELGSSKGVMRAREVAKTAYARLASPMETMLALMLTLSVSMGGFGLPRPEVNVAVPGLGEAPLLVSQETIIADLCWSDQKLIVEYYGWDEHFGAGSRKVGDDMARANSLCALGWNVLQVTYEHVRTLAGVSLLARQVAHLLGVSLREPTELELVWRSRLLALLLPNIGRAAG